MVFAGKWATVNPSSSGRTSGYPVYPGVLAHIRSIPISCEDQADVVIWHYTPKGNYEVRSGYHIAIQDSLQFDSKLAASLSFSPPASLWSFIWSLNIPLKVRHFWWRVCQNKLATKENLFRRKCAPSSQCPACVCPVESIEHLLFHYPWTRTVWFSSDLGIQVDMQVCNSVAEWTSSLMNMCSNKSEQLEIIEKVAMVDSRMQQCPSPLAADGVHQVWATLSLIVMPASLKTGQKLPWLSFFVIGKVSWSMVALLLFMYRQPCKEKPERFEWLAPFFKPSTSAKSVWKEITKQSLS
ncbi:hypothetical protein ACSBR2_005020 [Camellia fascicularis]